MFFLVFPGLQPSQKPLDAIGTFAFLGPDQVQQCLLVFLCFPKSRVWNINNLSISLSKGKKPPLHNNHNNHSYHQNPSQNFADPSKVPCRCYLVGCSFGSLGKEGTKHILCHTLRKGAIFNQIQRNDFLETKCIESPTDFAIGLKSIVHRMFNSIFF